MREDAFIILNDFKIKVNRNICLQIEDALPVNPCDAVQVFTTGNTLL